MDGEPIEVRVLYADWSDAARAGMVSQAGEAGLTAAPGDAGGLSLYLERDARGALLHVEVSDDGARQLYELLRAQFGKPTRRRAGRRAAKGQEVRRGA
jgi:hypothetical protein